MDANEFREIKEFIVVIGGGRSQLPFIEAVRKNGYKVIVFDRNENSPAKCVADLFYAVSTHDAPGILKILRFYQDKIATCFTYSSYPGALQTAAAINDALELPGLRGQALQICLSKPSFKERCREVSIRCPDARNCFSIEEAFSFFDKYPEVMVKPALGTSGSDGVSFISYDRTQLRKNFTYASELSSDRRVIVERYIDGLEYSVDGYVDQNTVSIFLISRKSSLGSSYGFAIDGFLTCPNIISDEQRISLRQTVVRCISAVGLKNSFFSLDVILKGNEFYFIDYGCLLDAKIDVLLNFAGLDIYSIPALALSKDWDSLMPNENLKQELALRLLYTKNNGRLNILGSDDSVTNSTKNNVIIFRADGDFIESPQSVADSLGLILNAGRNSFELWHTEWALDLVNSVVVE